ncbi:FecR domain-containing protein [Paenibacillus sp. FSL H8-0537]|uniref:FecR family protein n=1 Tax=Paenibacillus sp. FSL H8-0537 TaxID=2921399 RepID=UPI003101ADB8
MRSFKWLLVWMVVCYAALPAAAWAKDTDKVGKLTAVSGKAEVKKGGGTKSFNAFKGMAITQGDTIKTGSNGKVSMDLDSDKEVTIGANTTLLISELVKSASALGGKTKLTLQNGSVIIQVKKKLTGDSRFEIETPTATMGVMGTKFAVSYEQDNSYVGVLEGVVNVTGEDGERIAALLANEQIELNQAGEGAKGPLVLGDLPLVALEKLLEELEQAADTEANAALKQQISELVKQKQADLEKAEEAAGQPYSKPTIVYGQPASSVPASSGGNSGSGSGGSTPTPTPAVTPTPEATPTPTATATPDVTPTPVPTETPTPTPVVYEGAPEADTSAFYSNLYHYFINSTTIVIPFTTPLAFNEQEDDPNRTLLDGVIFAINDPEFFWEARSATIDGKNLVIQLSNELPLNSRLYISVRGDYLKNAQTGEVQADFTELGRDGNDIDFKPALNQTDLRYVQNLTETTDLDDIFVYHLGYSNATMTMTLASAEGPVAFDSEVAYYTQMSGENHFTFTINNQWLETLDAAAAPYTLSVKLDLEGEEIADLNMNIMVEDSRDLPYFDEEAFDSDRDLYIKNDHTFVLPFTTAIIYNEQAFPNQGLVQQVEFRLYDEQGDRSRRLPIEYVEISGKELSIYLAEAVPRGTRILVTIAGNSLKNPEKDKVQPNMLKTTERTFFNVSWSPGYVKHIKDSSMPNPPVTRINTMGDDLGEVRIYGGSEIGSRIVDAADYTIEQEPGRGPTITLTEAFYNRLDVGSHFVEVLIMQNGKEVSSALIEILILPARILG